MDHICVDLIRAEKPGQQASISYVRNFCVTGTDWTQLRRRVDLGSLSEIRATVIGFESCLWPTVRQNITARSMERRKLSPAWWTRNGVSCGQQPVTIQSPKDTSPVATSSSQPTTSLQNLLN